MTDSERTALAREKRLTTKGGLLYLSGVEVPLPHADFLAAEFGLVYAERLVKFLEIKSSD